MIRTVIPTLTTIRFSRPPDVSRRQWTDGMRAAWRELGTFWQREILPQHFTRAASARYRYQPRTGKYTKAKLLAGRGIGWLHRRVARQGDRVLYGGQVDNVLTGRMEAALKQPARVIAFPTRATVRMVGPRYMTFRPFTAAGSRHPDKADELRRMTPDDIERCTKVFAAAVQRRFTQAIPEPQTVTV